jgi:hypothetical protein
VPLFLKQQCDWPPGDHPLNLGTTTLVANAFLATGDPKYLAHVEDYLGAWAERTAAIAMGSEVICAAPCIFSMENRSGNNYAERCINNFSAHG